MDVEGGICVLAQKYGERLRKINGELIPEVAQYHPVPAVNCALCHLVRRKVSGDASAIGVTPTAQLFMDRLAHGISGSTKLK